MTRSLAYISSLVSAHDRPILDAAALAFDRVHLITFDTVSFPTWLSEYPMLDVHNLNQPEKPYDDPDESRFSNPLTRLHLAWALRSYGEVLRDRLGSLRPTVVHCSRLPTDAFLAARSRHRPFIVSPSEADIVEKPLVSRRLHRRIGWTLMEADRVVIEDEWVRDSMLQTYPNLDLQRLSVLQRPEENSKEYQNAWVDLYRSLHC